MSNLARAIIVSIRTYFGFCDMSLQTHGITLCFSILFFVDHKCRIVGICSIMSLHKSGSRHIFEFTTKESLLKNNRSDLTSSRSAWGVAAYFKHIARCNACWQRTTWQKRVCDYWFVNSIRVSQSGHFVAKRVSALRKLLTPLHEAFLLIDTVAICFKGTCPAMVVYLCTLTHRI